MRLAPRASAPVSVLAAILLTAGSAAAGTVCYVDSRATGANNGTSWADAYTDLQTALLAAQPPTTTEVWVAEGTYRPTLMGITQGKSFAIREGLGVYGGFSGLETSRAQARPEVVQTVLSGDLAGDDGPDLSNRKDNARNVVELDVGTTIEGFRITGGHADNYYKGGGGVASTPQAGWKTFPPSYVSRCTFDRNHAMTGGAVAVSQATLVSECVFVGNTAVWGGAVSSGTFSRCKFFGNSAIDGGAAYGNGLTCRDCVFSGNSAGRGGAVYGQATLVNCTMANNTATERGGGICVIPSGEQMGCTIENCVIWSNAAPLGAQVYVDNTQVLTMSFCNVEGGAPAGYGRENINADPLLVEPLGADGVAGTLDDDLHLRPGSPCVDAGTSTPIGVLGEDDIDGQPRSHDTDGDGVRTPEIGADELPTPPSPLRVGPNRIVLVAGQEPAAASGNAYMTSVEGVLWHLTPECNSLQVTPAETINGMTRVVVALKDDAAGPLPFACRLLLRQDGFPGPVGEVQVGVIHANHLVVPTEYPTIQAALNAAPQNGMVVVLPGLYRDRVAGVVTLPGRMVSLRSLFGAELTWIEASLLVPEGRVDGLGIGSGVEMRGSAVVSNCIILGSRFGDGVTIDGPGVLAGSTISGATHTGVYCSGGTVIGCTIKGNQRGLYLGDGATLVKTSVTNNEVSGAETDSGVTIQDCLFEGNGRRGIHRTGYGDGQPLIVSRCTVRNNGGHGLLLKGPAQLTDCLLAGNGRTYGGGALQAESTDVELLRCRLLGNQSAVGGAIAAINSRLMLRDCLLADNQAQFAGGAILSSSGSSLTLDHCTVVANTAPVQGGGIYLGQDTGTIRNSIVWGNSSASGPQLYLKFASFAHFTAVDLQGGPGAIAYFADLPVYWEGGLDAEPGFVDADGPDDDPATWADNDYHLAAGSACIDMGFMHDGLSLMDIDLQPRVQGCRPDLGFDEAPATQACRPLGIDADADFDVDADDLAAFEACMSAAGIRAEPACTGFDSDSDGDVDQDDFGMLQGCLGGPGLPPDTGCRARVR